jgi:hypothetical protein
MNSISRPSVLVMLAALILPLQVHAAARAEALDMDEKDRAAVSKETLKQKRESAGNKAAGPGGNSSNCGSVDIGNDSKDKKGSNRIAEREKTVIVTGNIINTARCK